VIHSKLLAIIPFFLIALPAVLPAQTAADLETVLRSPTVSSAQAARFVLSSSGMSVQVVPEKDAYERAVSSGWLAKTAADDPITMGRLSYLMMEAFGLKGGVMYAIFPGPRYAYRSMVSRNFIQGASDPALIVSGERFLLILGKVLNALGDGQ